MPTFVNCHFKVALVNWIIADDQAWDHNFRELKRELAQSVRKISLTMDLWDNKSMCAYGAVTAHYLCCGSVSTSLDGRGELALHSTLIGFLPLPGFHFSQDLAKGLLFITDRVNITDNTRIFLHIL
ncbi:hypothetical protein JB92DRAFT_2837756 [Gautieria morchelliformis]|nr:hypothetical protein JB92DRAFT_2837756 [Gautieria morchelliformis]